MPLRPGARAWAVWAAVLFAHIVAVLHRTSPGVAGSARGRISRPIREVLTERRGFSPLRTGKGDRLEREPEKVSRGGHV
jgi:hypothetical protein